MIIFLPEATRASIEQSVSPCWAHLIVDFDGSVSCLADVIAEQTYHATSVNPVSVGIEIAQGAAGELWAEPLDCVVRLVDWLTTRLAIQRQIPDRYRGPVERLRRGARDAVLVFGHRDQTAMRGQGDPGDEIFRRLALAGYETFDVSAGEDLRVWRLRQYVLGVSADGIPGPATVEAIKTFQHARGLEATGLADRATREVLAELSS